MQEITNRQADFPELLYIKYTYPPGTATDSSNVLFFFQLWLIAKLTLQLFVNLPSRNIPDT
jgi:hypothetical protein